MHTSRDAALGGGPGEAVKRDGGSHTPDELLYHLPDFCRKRFLFPEGCSPQFVDESLQGFSIINIQVDRVDHSHRIKLAENMVQQPCLPHFPERRKVDVPLIPDSVDNPGGLFCRVILFLY